MSHSDRSLNHKQTPRAGLALAGIHKAYDRDVVLTGLDLTVPAGEFLTLLGPSGCGKTTLLRLVAGLESPDRGDVRINDQNVTDVPAHRRAVNTVFQSYALFEHLNVEDNIGFGPRMRGVGKRLRQRWIGDIAALIHIEALLDRHIGQLSGGQKQRVALARALINEPKLLLLDEPLSALDAGLRAVLQSELRRIQRALGTTFLMVTHDQQEAMAVSDRIAVLGDAKIQQIDTPRVLYETPRNRFVAEFMGHDNLFAVRARSDAGVVTDLGVLAGVAGRGETVLIRPEAVTFAVELSGAAVYGLETRVHACQYLGGVIEYTLDCGAATLVARGPNLGQALYEPGDTATVSIARRGVVTLDD